MLLGIHTAIKEDLQCTAAELVYGVSLRLPGEYFSVSSPSSCPDPGYITRLKQCMSALRATPTHTPRIRNSFIDNSLSSTSHVFIRRDSVRWLLQQPYDGPFQVLSRKDKYFVVDINGKHDTVSIDRLKAAHMDYSVSPDTLPTTPATSTVDSSSSIPHTQPSPTDSRSPVSTRTWSGRHVHFPDRLNL